MGTLNPKELKMLYDHALGSKFIIEVGSGGSTHYLGRAAKKSKSIIYSIDLYLPQKKDRYPYVKYLEGWSVSFDDIIKPGDPKFIKCERYHDLVDEKVLMCGKEYMKGETDLIRTIASKHEEKVDFFFCDTGEYCGLAEWNIMKEMLPIGGKFTAHDIYYPKSIKCFQVLKEIEQSDNWRVLEKTQSRKGIVIAEKLF